MSSERARRRSRVNDPLWQGGFIVGAAIGAVATVLGRRAERCSRIVEKARIEPKRFTDLSRSRGSRTRGRCTGSRCPQARRRTRAAA